MPDPDKKHFWLESTPIHQDTWFKDRFINQPIKPIKLNTPMIMVEKSIEEKIDDLTEAVNNLNRKIDLIFGNSVCLNGKFVDLKDIK